MAVQWSWVYRYCGLLYHLWQCSDPEFVGTVDCCTTYGSAVILSLLVLWTVVSFMAVQWSCVCWYCGLLYHSWQCSDPEFVGTVDCCTTYGSAVNLSLLVLWTVVPVTAVQWSWVWWYCGLLYHLWHCSDPEFVGTVDCCTTYGSAVILTLLVLWTVVPLMAVQWSWVCWYCGLLYHVWQCSYPEFVGTVDCCTSYSSAVILSLLVLWSVVPRMAVQWSWVCWYCGLLYHLWQCNDPEVVGTVYCCIIYGSAVILSLLVLWTVVPVMAVQWSWVWLYCGLLYHLDGIAVILCLLVQWTVFPVIAVQWSWVWWYCGLLYQLWQYNDPEFGCIVDCCTIYGSSVILSVLQKEQKGRKSHAGYKTGISARIKR
jgi:hypothetical protein